jgi:hypothetical protein
MIDRYLEDDQLCAAGLFHPHRNWVNLKREVGYVVVKWRVRPCTENLAVKTHK